MIIKCPYCTRSLNVPDASLRVGNPMITCTGCSGKFKVKEEKKAEPKKQNATKPKSTDAGGTILNATGAKKKEQYHSTEAGWLVVHDERTKQQTFTLKEGKLVVGRRSESKPCDVMIETNDMYMSRNHFYLDVKRFADGRFAYSISDCNATNHTYVNLMELRDGDELYLKDGDTIQAGETKIVFKSSGAAKNSHEATKFVSKTDFNKTVLIQK